MAMACKRCAGKPEAIKVRHRQSGRSSKILDLNFSKLIDRGLTISGETVPYSPNSTAKNKMRAILDDAMAAVELVSRRPRYSPTDLRALAERELEALKHEGGL